MPSSMASIPFWLAEQIIRIQLSLTATLATLSQAARQPSAKLMERGVVILAHVIVCTASLKLAMYCLLNFSTIKLMTLHEILSVWQ